jgi:guanylate cyclase
MSFQIKDLRHDNLNAFIGLALEKENVMAIWGYCQKRSLNDILANNDIRLDSSFCLNFANDIAKVCTNVSQCNYRVSFAV